MTEDIIKHLHFILKHDTHYSTLGWFVVGDFKHEAKMVGGRETTKPADARETTKPADAPARMREPLSTYNALANVTIEDVISFHAQFERIHPFQDGNGRIVTLKECLHRDIIPFINEDSKKHFYYRGLAGWEAKRGWLTDTCLDGQDTFVHLFDMLDIPHQ